MKLHFLKDDALETLRTNAKYNAKNYSKPTNEWVFDYFKDENPFDEFKYEVNDFSLKILKDDPASADLENIKTLYTNLKMLTDSQAVDERFWVGLAHHNFWSYMNQRLDLTNKVLDGDEISKKFFFHYGKRKSLLVHPLAKLWWTGRNTYDETRSDPFELTRFFRKNYYHNNLILFGFSYSNNEKIVRAFLRAMLEIESDGTNVTTKIFDDSVKYLNILSGTYLLDYLEEDELKLKIKSRAEEFIVEN